jgi:hypothetical protein
MSNEIKCHVLILGPSKDVEAFTTNFEREQFNAHVPIPVGAQPKAECDEIYLSRQLGIEHWGTRFIYPHPGVSTLRGGETALIQNELHLIEREGYEHYVPPTHGDAVALITFTVPSDPPSLWAEQVISQYHDRGLMFMIRWWDMENYHRCTVCGALDGICLRAGAFWSVSGGASDPKADAALWWGKAQCHCRGFHDSRKIGADDYCHDDSAIVAQTAFEDGADSIRIVATSKTGKRSMLRVCVPAGGAAALVREINEMNTVFGGPDMEGSLGKRGL